MASSTRQTGKRSQSSLQSTSEPVKKRRPNPQNRSIWNTPDDWDTLVADSQLSTASVSVRKAPPRGLQTLVQWCINSSARHFKRLWDERSDNDESSRGMYWKVDWEWVPDHLKVRVRDQIFNLWGSHLTCQMLTEVFATPPNLHLPGHLLSSVSTSTLSRPLRPTKNLDQYTSLVLTYAQTMTDVGLAELIYHLPNLESVNLKGCPLVKDRVVKSMIQRCPRLRRINLKGTGVDENGVQKLLDRFGQQLECFKVDSPIFEHINTTFASSPYPNVTHLCLPGDLLNLSKTEQTRRRRIMFSSTDPTPRQTAANSILDWKTISTNFPSLTHLYLPRSLIPHTHFGLKRDTLVKLVLSSDPFPLETFVDIIKDQQSLRKLQFGFLASKSSNAYKVECAYEELEEALKGCKLESFKLHCDLTNSTKAVRDMTNYGHWLFSGMNNTWRGTLKHLSLSIPRDLDPMDLEHWSETGEKVDPVLEILEIPGATWYNSETFVQTICQFKKLRTLDLSMTSVNDQDVFKILDHCPSLSRIDLSSCRGVKVQNRRKIFKAWEEDRNPASDRRMVEEGQDGE